MARFTVCSNLIEACAVEHYYLTNVLYHFVQDNHCKIVVDSEGRILALYAACAMKHEVIKHWLDHLAKRKPRSALEKVALTDGPIEHRQLFWEACGATVGQKMLLCDSIAEYSMFGKHLLASGIELIDRDEAVTKVKKLCTEGGDMTVINNDGGIVIDKSKVEQSSISISHSGPQEPIKALKELEQLRDMISKGALSAEEFSAVGRLADAELSLKRGRVDEAKSFLMPVWKGIVELSSKVGAAALVETVKSHLGV